MFIEKARAKLNLNLHLLPNITHQGFYPVHFINCEIDLYDELIFRNIKENIEVVWSTSPLLKPNEKEDLIYKAALSLKNLSGAQGLGASVTVNKRIPIRAGFGGGSSDAAATIRGLVKLWKLDATNKEKKNLASGLGTDVSYCLAGGLSEIGGLGEIVMPLNYKLPEFWLVIVVLEETKPSTEWMYKHVDTRKIGQNLDKVSRLKNAIKSSDKTNILRNLHNDFESSVVKFFPEVGYTIDRLTAVGVKQTLMAGSGLSVVGFFENQDEAKWATAKLKKYFKTVLYVKTN